MEADQIHDEDAENVEESNDCEFCGCNGDHEGSCKFNFRKFHQHKYKKSDASFAVKQLVNKIEEFQEQNVFMYTRIMEAFKKVVPQIDVHLASNDFDIKRLPYGKVEDLLRLNELCKTQPTVRMLLVST